MGSLSLEGRCDGSNLSHSDLEELRSSVKGKIIFKHESSEEEYRNAIDRWAETSIKPANIVVFVDDEEDVSNTIKFVTKHRLDVAIAGGRHSHHGASSAHGLVIDLRRMKAIHIDLVAKTITAQGGCKAVDLEVPLEKEGLAVVLGTVNDTGIGGLTTGGGSGWLTGQYGNVVDNLLSARVALADGRVVEASETENPDLFWGIRGGGSNFGVCTEFRYQAYEQGDVFFGFMMFPPEKFQENISLTPKIYNSICASDGKLQAFLAVLLPPGSTELVALWIIFYNGPETEAREWLRPLYDLGPNMDTTKVTNYSASTALDAGETVRRRTVSVGQLEVPIDLDILHSTCDSYKSLMEKYGAPIGASQLVIELQSPHVCKTVRPDKMAYANRREAISVAVDLKWTDPSLDQRMREEAVAISRLVKQMGEKQRRARLVKDNISPDAQNKDDNTNDVTVNANYSTGQEKVASIFGNNLSRLRVIKRKYDPDCVWNKWYCIPPAIE